MEREWLAWKLVDDASLDFFFNGLQGFKRFFHNFFDTVKQFIFIWLGIANQSVSQLQNGNRHVALLSKQAGRWQSVTCKNFCAPLCGICRTGQAVAWFTKFVQLHLGSYCNRTYACPEQHSGWNCCIFICLLLFIMLAHIVQCFQITIYIFWRLHFI